MGRPVRSSRRLERLNLFHLVLGEDECVAVMGEPVAAVAQFRFPPGHVLRVETAQPRQDRSTEPVEQNAAQNQQSGG